MSGLYIVGTGTNVGKTLVTRGLARASARAGHPVAAVKPIETGSNPDPLDALALATACGHLELAHAAGFYRAKQPLAPLAATLGGEKPPPSLGELVRSVRSATAAFHVKLVEAAGGLLSPIDSANSMLELGIALGLPFALVARDELGALSAVRTAHLCAKAAGVTVRSVILTHEREPFAFNAQILREHIGAESSVISFRIDTQGSPSTDDELADEVLRLGLNQTLLGL